MFLIFHISSSSLHIVKDYIISKTVCNMAHSLDFNIDDVDKKTIYLIYGFIGTWQRILSLSSNIPSEIKNVILYFYNYLAQEYFTFNGNQLTLNNDKSIVTKNIDTYNIFETVYGNISINYSAIINLFEIIMPDNQNKVYFNVSFFLGLRIIILLI